MIESVGNLAPSGPTPRAEEAREKAAAERREGTDQRDNARLQAEGPLVAVGRPLSPAPEHVDPDVWSHLNPDEQDYFARVQALGPVTYGRAALAPVPAAATRGTHLDIRG